ncbi:MAG: peptide deformylase [Gammaproteobacteria bacterium]
MNNTKNNYQISSSSLIDSAVQCCEKQCKHHACVLHHRCQPIPIADINSDAFQQALQFAAAKRQQLQGIGIAANQLGLPYQFFLIERDPNNSRYKTAVKNEIYIPLTYYINPIITAVSNERVCLYHGCLSCVGANRGLVATYKTIDVEYYTEKATKVARQLSAWEAIIFQHEYNHLLGRTYLNVAKEYISTEQLLADNDGKVPAPREIAAIEDIPVMIPKAWIGMRIEDIVN